MLLQRRIEHFLKRSGIRPARFGRDALRDPRFVFDLRRGRELRPVTVKRINAYLDEQESALAGAGEQQG